MHSKGHSACKLCAIGCDNKGPLTVRHTQVAEAAVVAGLGNLDVAMAPRLGKSAIAVAPAM